jgi:hypothetical protein
LDPRFAGSDPAEGDRFLRAIKIRSTPSFGKEVKPSAPRRKILRLAKSLFEVLIKIFHKAEIIISFASSSCFATKRLCWQDFQRALVDESGVFPCRDYSTMVLHAYISPGG